MISIIIPLYNQADKLERCLHSISLQSFDNFEVIVVNDRSKDRLTMTLKKYAHIFGLRFRALHNQSNHGAPYTRNKGFRASKGEYIMFCDADIVMEPEMLFKLHRKLSEDKSAAYAYSSHKFGHKRFDKLEWSEERLRNMPFIHTTALIRREAFPKGGFDEKIKRLQDWDLWLTMLESGHKGVWVPELLFRVETGGTMSSWLPSAFYRLFPFLPKARRYEAAVATIKAKHNLG
jgi:glycosyltransferase involved in cell wall biosynthesis